MKEFTYTWKTTMKTAACGTALQKYSVFLVQVICDLFSK